MDLCPSARFALVLCTLAIAVPAASKPGRTEAPPLAAVTVVGPTEIVFDHRKQGCGGTDVPDAPARAFRDAKGEIVLFAPHYDNRALRGPSFEALKLDCRTTLPSGENEDPAAYNDASWIAATWTDDGARVAALVHHEYHAAEHPGRCRMKDNLSCWYNTVVGVSSTDGGASFQRSKIPAVVAASPFRQEVDQGRHRGFFNPSNIVRNGAYRYVFAATTGWDGQSSGACLFRSENPFDPGSWRAFDGQSFSIRYSDPYRASGPRPRECKPLAPFPAPVGAIVRHRPTGAWVAVFQAAAGGELPEAGFYTTSSRDLLAWDKPRLILPGKTNYDDPCGAKGTMISYPSLIDRNAPGRNFDEVGDSADLYFTTLRVEGCTITSERDLVRRRVTIKVWP